MTESDEKKSLLEFGVPPGLFYALGALCVIVVAVSWVVLNV